MTTPALSFSARLSLHTRLSLILTALIASLLLALGGLWLKGTHNGINEEIEAASRVAGQWLTALARPMRNAPSAAASAQLLAEIEAIGRIRANSLEVLDATPGPQQGRRLYLSPPSPYKSGRRAPAWFAALVEPSFAPLVIDAGPLTLRINPDPGRSTLDAWDELCAMTGWALSLLALLFIGSRYALDRTLRPLEQIMAALDRTGPGRLDTRLPVYADPQLGRLSRAFNGMAIRLAEAVHHNLQLEDDRELSRQLQQRLEAQRRAIARELHDELAQGITAVRALAGAIAQRTGEQPALHGHAQSIVAVTGQLQDGVRHILQRLRPVARRAAGSEPAALEPLLRQHLANWQQQHPHIALQAEFELGTAALGNDTVLAALRIAQEGLTNIAKHAAASAVCLSLRHGDDRLQLCLSDNGRGLGQHDNPAAGCGLGLLGMRERATLLGGELQLDNLPSGGACLQAWLPAAESTAQENLA